MKSAKTEAVVIGSGAGGGVVAKELGEKGISVVVLETGRRFDPLEDYTSARLDWERAAEVTRREKFGKPDDDDIVTDDDPYRHDYRPNIAFGVGGTTLRYLAYVPRMLPDDFRGRSLDGAGADWPIAYEDLAPHYRKVELELMASGRNGDPWGSPMEPYPNPPFEFSWANKILKRGCDRLGIRLWPSPAARLSRPSGGRPACVQCGRCQDGCLSGAKSSIDVTYIPKAEATGKVEIRPESTVTRITVDPKGKARSVIYLDKKGVEHELKAEVIVVSAGAVHSPLLLLNSKSSLFPDGLANGSGLVGKNFMQHLKVTSTALFPERIDSYRGFSGGAYSRDFARTERGRGFVRGWQLSLHSGELSAPAHMALTTTGWGASHKDYMRKHFGHMAGLSAIGEQLPDERNRVELASETAARHGLPVPRFTFELGENDKALLAAMEKNVREIFRAAGASEVLIMKFRLGSGSHNLGTCRMGDDPGRSVLNSYCQSHEVSNLFVVDGSCFVTCGTGNPAVTIMAIAARAAEFIAEQGKKGGFG